MNLQLIKLCFWLFGSFIFTFSLSCSKDKHKVDVPSYMHIDNIDVSTDLITEGSASDNIIDAWVFVDDQLIGTYELPSTFPISSTGIHKIEIRAGIRKDGQVSNRIVYPFYAPYTDNTFNLIEDNVHDLSPIVSYYGTASFKWIEGFESPTLKVEDAPSSKATLVRLTDPEIVFEGVGCGAVYLNSAISNFEISSVDPIKLPTGTNVYLEFDYKTDQYMEVGLYANTAGAAIKSNLITLKPREEWNKIYIYLTSDLTDFSNADDFTFYFSGKNDLGLDSSAFYLDNIKIVY